jgi:hypothetical protein
MSLFFEQEGEGLYFSFAAMNTTDNAQKRSLKVNAAACTMYMYVPSYCNEYDYKCRHCLNRKGKLEKLLLPLPSYSYGNHTNVVFA